MQQALEALEKISMGGSPQWADDVIPALRQALEQPIDQSNYSQGWKDGYKHGAWADKPYAKVSPLEFVEMVYEKEHLTGKPMFWAEWPNKENT